MKITKVLFAAALAAFVVSCTSKVSEVTQIKGTVNADGIDAVAVVVGTTVDTLVPVVDGKFAIDVPTDMTVLAVVSAGNYSANFIADGTPLTVVLDAESKVTSKYPKVSVQERMNQFAAAEDGFGREFTEKRMKIMADTLLTDEQKQAAFMEYYDSFIVTYKAHNMEVVSANSDNFVALYALQNLRGECNDEELSALIAGLCPELQQHRFVVSMQEAVNARLETAPGKMFKDFTVKTVVGQTRSIPPQPKYAEVKLSDYVGKGKYILLDFWSPWCGPCKREMPNIKTILEKYSANGFDVVSIAVWERQPVEVTINTAAELGMTWNQINNAGGEPAAIYGVEAIPHLILFGPDGTILDRGFHGLEGMESAIAAHIQ